MPIVNLSNYVRCWSCNRAMHLPAYADPKTNGNRAFMCQECYERADAQGRQFTKEDNFQHGELSSASMASGSIPAANQTTTQAFQGECNQQEKTFIGADYTAEMTPLKGFVIVRCDQETGAKFVLPKIYQQLKFASSELALMEPAPGFAYCIATLGTPVARAKWEMPTEEEAKYCWSIYSNFKAGFAESMREALRIFVELRNHKL